MIKSIKEIRKILDHLAYILTSTQKKESVGVFVAMIIGSFLELLGVSLMYPFLQSVLNPQIIKEKWYLKGIFGVFPNITDNQVILSIGIIIALVFLIKNAGVLFSSYIQIRYSARFSRELSTRMLDSYMKRPYEFFVNTNSSYIIRGIAGDVSSVYQIILCGFQMMAEIINIILIGAYLIRTDVIIAGMSIAVATVCFLCITLGFKGIMKKAGQRVRDEQTWQNRCSYQAIVGIKEITILGRRQSFVKKYEDVSKRVEKFEVSSKLASAAPDRIIEGICMSGVMLVVCFRLLMGMDMTSFVPVLGVFAMGAFKLFPSISKISSRLNQIVFCMPGFDNAYNNIKEVERIENEQKLLQEEGQVDSESLKRLGFKKNISIIDVHFNYSNNTQEVLRGISFSIEKGSSVGLIGASGAGKSTLADIIMGLFDPQQGRIEIDGVDIKYIKRQLAGMIGYVPQNVFLVDDTVRANVAFGLMKENVSDDKVWDALERAQIKDFIAGLPDGLDTMVGEFGVRFSGGQRQRIAIARALYESPEILILDEATAALDNDTEKALMEAIESLQGTVTMIIVAHRLTTIRNCNKIYEIKEGMALERRKEDIFI